MKRGNYKFSNVPGEITNYDHKGCKKIKLF